MQWATGADCQTYFRTCFLVFLSESNFGANSDHTALSVSLECEVAVPLPLLTEHIKPCNVIDVDRDSNLANVDISEPEERKCKKYNVI